MLSPYGDVLRRPGAFAMSTTGFLARFPMAMLGLGEVLLVSRQTGSYALAGALSATGALANAVFGPSSAGPPTATASSRVLPLLVAVHVVSLTAFVVLVRARRADVALFASVTLSGGTFPNLGALVRARWAFLLAGEPPLLRTAFACESVLDEVIYVAGPPLATVLAVSVVDYGALARGRCCLVAGHRAVRPLALDRAAGRRHAADAGRARRCASPASSPSPLAFVFLGALFGSFEVVTVAFADEQGVRGWTGLLLGLYALASGASGVVLGAVHVRATLDRQLLLFSGLLALATVPFPFISSPWVLGVQCLVAGLAVSPVLISGFALIERLVPNARMTEGLVWSNTGLGVRLAVAAALAGPVIDARGASTAYWICVGSAVLTFLVVLGSRRTLAARGSGAPASTEGADA